MLKITFFILLLAFVTVALAIPAGKDEKPKTKDNIPTKPEEKENLEVAIPVKNEDKFKTEESKLRSAKEKDKGSSEGKYEEPSDDETSTHSSSEENDEESSGDDENSTEEQTMYAPETPEEKRCTDLIGGYVNNTFVGLEVNHDLQKILEEHGGPPGKVNATWTEKEDGLVEAEDLEKRPLPDADEKYWIYKYGASDAETYIRTEHAVRRFSGTPKAFLEIRGEVYFTPKDFCGKSRTASYVVDDRGFTFEVSRVYCWISQTVYCAPPASCESNEDGVITSCIAGPGIQLLASLIGGGK